MCVGVGVGVGVMFKLLASLHHRLKKGCVRFTTEALVRMTPPFPALCTVTYWELCVCVFPTLHLELPLSRNASMQLFTSAALPQKS